LAAGLRNRLADRVVQTVEQGGRALLRLAGQLVGLQAPYEAADLEDLARHRLAACRWGDVIVSYRTGLMRYREWGKAEYSYAFRRFKQRLERLHFVRVECPRHTAVFVLAELEDQPRPQAVLWWFFPGAAWPAVERQLNAWFELGS
jgi:hypothetical protein